MDRQLFEQMYQGQAPWDTGRPQPVIVKLAEAGQIVAVFSMWAAAPERTFSIWQPEAT